MNINTNMFTLTKNKFKKEGDKMPDYKLSTKVDTTYVEIGAAWLKTSEASGAKYLSVKLAEGLSVTGTVVPYQKKTQTTPTQAEMDF